LETFAKTLTYFYSFKCKTLVIYRLDLWRAAALIEVVDAERSWALVMASETGVIGGAGVVVREGAALRLCCM
jgi:hypothetical protein